MSDTSTTGLPFGTRVVHEDGRTGVYLGRGDTGIYGHEHTVCWSGPEPVETRVTHWRHDDFEREVSPENSEVSP